MGFEDTAIVLVGFVSVAILRSAIVIEVEARRGHAKSELAGRLPRAVPGRERAAEPPPERTREPTVREGWILCFV